jgi:hypothetical protein
MSLSNKDKRQLLSTLQLLTGNANARHVRMALST